MASTDHPRRPAALLAAVLVAAILLAACGGGDGPSAETVAIHWRQALEKGDYASAWELYAPGHRPGATKAEGVAFLNKVELGKPLSPGAAAVSIKAVRAQGHQDEGGGWVYLQVQTKDTDRNHLESVRLGQTDGHWGVIDSEPAVPYVGWVR